MSLFFSKNGSHVFLLPNPGPNPNTNTYTNTNANANANTNANTNTTLTLGAEPVSLFFSKNGSHVFLLQKDAKHVSVWTV